MTTTERFHRILIEHTGVPADQIRPDANFADDLGCDSLDMVDLTMSVEDEFNIVISDDEAAAMPTVGEALSLIERKLAG